MWLLKRFILMMFITVFVTTVTIAQPLQVAVTPFTPPFSFKTSSNNYYGFDISLMLEVCQILKRECIFKSMEFDKLLNEVANNRSPVAISSITITPERLKTVNFSKPYIPSECSFLTHKKNDHHPFDLTFLDRQRFGIVRGNIFEEVIRSLGVNNAPVIRYRDNHALIDALNRNNVSMIMLDTPAAFYWQMQSKGMFKTFGKPFKCGYGIGIAINKDNTELLQEINNAIDLYHQSEAFKTDYNRYINYKFMIK